MTTARTPPGNSGLAIWLLSCFYETFVQGSTAVILLSFCAKYPPHRQAQKRHMPFMRTYLLVTFFFFSGQVFGQRPNTLVTTYRIDTLNKGTDSSTFFIRKYIDTTLVESYKCKFDSTDFTYRLGLFRLKKGKAREYRPVNISDKKEYPWREIYPGLRDGDGELRIISRQD